MKKMTNVGLSLGLLALVSPAFAQTGEGDIAVALSNASYQTNFAYYDASTGLWSNPASDTKIDNYDFGSGFFGPDYMQMMEFDNAGGVCGLPNGNLLAATFGSGWTAFEIHNLSTDGSNQWGSLWSMAAESGSDWRTSSQGWNVRGGGLSISPSGTRVAFSSYDGYSHTDFEGDLATGSQIMVLDYDRGANPGTGLDYNQNPSEANIYGPRLTGDKPGIGSAGITGSTQGTTWLTDDIVLLFNAAGEVIKWDVSGVPAGYDANPRFPQAPNTTPRSDDLPTTQGAMNPNVALNWEVANSEVSFSGQYTDIEYCPAIEPNKIFAAVTKSSFDSELFMFSYDRSTGAITLLRSMTVPNDEVSGDPQETREIAFDKDGNLYFSCYAGSGSTNLVARFNGASDPDNWADGDPANNIEVIYTNGQYSPYNGLDVATNLPNTCDGDANRDGVVDGADFNILLSNWGSGNSWFEGDFNGDETVDGADFNILLSNWGDC